MKFENLYIFFAIIQQLILSSINYKVSEIYKFFNYKTYFSSIYTIIFFVVHIISKKYKTFLVFSFTSLVVQLCYLIGIFHDTLNMKVVGFFDFFIKVKYNEPLILLIFSILIEGVLFSCYQYFQNYYLNLEKSKKNTEIEFEVLNFNFNDGNKCNRDSYMQCILTNRIFYFFINLILSYSLSYLLHFDLYLVSAYGILKILLILTYTKTDITQGFILYIMSVIFYLIFYLGHSALLAGKFKFKSSC